MRFYFFAYLWRMITLTLIILLTVWSWRKDKLNKINRTHQGKYIPLASAKRIGLIINASEPGAYKCASIFSAEMERHKKDYVIACLDTRRKSAQQESLPQSDKILLLDRKQLTWYGSPKQEIVKAFAGVPMDILIDFTLFRKYYPLEYLFRSAQTTLRLGIASARAKDYDLIIQSGMLQKDTTADVQTKLMKHILTYLQNIK